MWLGKKCNINQEFKVNDKLMTPIIYLIAVKNCEDEIILKEFIDAGCDLNAVDSDGMSLLIHSIKINSEVLVRYLLS